MFKHPVLVSLLIVILYLYHRQEIDRMKKSIRILQFNLKKFNDRITKLEEKNCQTEGASQEPARSQPEASQEEKKRS